MIYMSSQEQRSFKVIVASGHLKMILNSQGVDSLTIVKMAASHMEAYILMRSSAKMEERHIVPMLKHLFSWYVVFKNKIPVLQFYE